MPILTEKTKRLMGVKRGETMTHDVWDKIHQKISAEAPSFSYGEEAQKLYLQLNEDVV